MLGSTWKNLTDNRLMNVVAVSSTAMALLIMGGVLLFQQNVSTLIRGIKSRTSMVVYLEEGIPPGERRKLQSRLISQPGVRDVAFESKKAAREAFRRRMNARSDLLEGLEKNPFPASFEVRLEPEALPRIQKLAGTFSDLSGVESVDYAQEMVGRLQGISQAVEVVLGVIGVVICLVAVFIIFNTIQLAVMSRRDEIDILKLVGATRRFIGIPFVLGGVVQGLLGCVFGLGFLWVLYWVVASRLSDFAFWPVPLSFLDPWRLGTVAGLGTLLGVIGSVTAVFRSVRRM